MVYRLVYTSAAGSFYIQYGAGAEKKIPFFMPINQTTQFPDSVTKHSSLESAIIGRDRFLQQDSTKDVKVQYRKSNECDWSYVVDDHVVLQHLSALDCC